MFRSIDQTVEKRRELRELEAQASRIRLRQAVIVNDLDKVNIAGGDGHRSMNEWLSAELDVSATNASELVFAGRHLAKHRPINFHLAEGHITFDRGVATMRLAEAGADESTLTHSEDLDLPAVRRLTAQQRRMTRRTEHQVFTDRFVSVQPTLDGTSRRITAELPGVDGHMFEQALHARTDELRLLPGGDQYARGQLQADALVSMAQDSLNRNHKSEASTGGGSVSILVDLDTANGTGGETGCEIEYGPRVGPSTLEELLCTG